VCLAESVEVNEQVVPWLLLLVAVLGGLEGEECHAPCVGGDKVFVRSNNIKGTANLAARLEFSEDGGGVVGGLFAVEDRAGGFEKLGVLVVY
jgi:hypothetical protein